MPSKSMSPMPMQAKIGDASLKFGPDWLRALSSDTGGTGPAPPGGSAGGGGGGGAVHNSWASGAGGGGGTSGLFADRHSGHNSGGGFSSSSNSSHHHLSHSQSWGSASFKDGKSPPNFGGGGSLPVPATPVTPSKFKLSEFRYSREEMLALFDKNLDAPNYLPAFGNLFIEKTQTPLAFSQASEDELRIWQISQPESSRQAGQVSGAGGPAGTAPVGRGGFTMRGRGGPGVERGRGRGRGGGTAGGYYAPRPHEEEDRGGYRPRGFERSQSAHERAWGDRNGTVAGPGPSPPEENAPRGGSWRTREGFGGGGNTRRHDEDDSGWRSSKPRWRRDDEDDSPRGPGQRRPHRSWSDDGGHDLPEWAKDNPCEESGTFDASGAFHGEDRQAGSNSTGPGARSSHNDDIRRDDSKTRHESEPSKGSHGDNDRVQKRTPERNDGRLTIPPVKEEHEPELDGKTSSLEHRQEFLSSTSRQNSHNAASEHDFHREDAKQVAPSDMTASKIEDRSRQQNVLQGREEMFRRPPNTQQIGGVKAVEEDFFSMTEEADSLVAKLIDDDLIGTGHGSPPIDNVLQAFANHSAIIASKTQQQVNVGALNITAGMLHAESKQVKSHPAPGTHGISPAAFDTWLYRDPQGSVQGPFATHEMAQWYAQGYFSGNLLLRRDCDSKFITLADMCKMYKRNPFIPIPDASPPPPINEPSALGQADPIQSQMQLQYQQQLIQMHREQQIQQQSQQIQQQSQQFMMNLAHNLGRGNTKVEEPSPWQGGDRRMTESDALLANISKNQAGNLNSANPIEHLHAALQRQLQAQGKSGGDSQQNPSADFLRSLIQPPGSQPIDMRKSPVQTDPIQTLMQKLTNMANSQQQSQQRPPAAGKMENSAPQQLPQMWGHPNQNPGVSQQQTQPQTQSGMPWMAGNQMWDYREQMMGLQQRQMHEKEIRLKEEENRRKREEEVAEQEALKRHDEARRLEEEKRKQLELEMLKQQEERQREERKQAEMQRQKDIQRQEMLLQQQQQRMQLEQQQRLDQQRLEQQRLEQQRAEQQRQEQQRLQQQRMHELEEQQRLEKQKHMEREQQELQAKIQQQERMAWQQKQNALLSKQQQPRSLIEIQQEEAMKQQQEEMIRQQQLKKQMQEQAEQQRQAQLQAQKSGFNLKWAQAAGPQGSPKIKSLTEIQAEEQAKLAKQQQKQRQDQAVYHQHQQSQQSWSSALTWADRASMNASNKSNGAAWDEPAPAQQQQRSSKQNATSPSNFGPSPSRQVPPGNSANSQTAAAKRKEAEDSLLRLFQDHTAQQSQQASNVVKPDEFTRWCNEALSALSATVDIPVFIGFLKEVESPYEVTDYVKLYVGEGREAKDFAKEFLERRSRWRNSNKKGGSDGNGGSLQGFDVDGSGNSVSGLGGQSANDFQEVKGKGKKNKKGKMQKVDSKILGFSTAGAPDRLNVGKRDYGEFE